MADGELIGTIFTTGLSPKHPDWAEEVFPSRTSAFLLRSKTGRSPIY
jgi:hypothetical protein